MATLKFQVRSTQLSAYYSFSGANSTFISSTANDAVPPTVDASGLSGVFGASVLNLHPVSSTTIKGLVYRGFQSTPGTLARSVLIRIVPTASGAPANAASIYTTGYGDSQIDGDYAVVDNTGKVQWFVFSPSGATAFGATSSTLTITNNVPTDILMTWDGTTAAGGVRIYQDGVSIFNGSASNNTWTVNQDLCAQVVIGKGPSAFSPPWTINEFVMWEGVQSVTYPRSAFITTSAFDGSFYTAVDPLIVLNGQNYTVAGVVNTGTLNSTDPGVGNVRSGQGYFINSASRTGTLVVPGTSTDPGVANVLSGVGYQINGSSFTGTLALVYNSGRQFSIKQNPTGGIPQVITQGDSFPLPMICINEANVPYNLTSATMTTTMLSESGTEIVFTNSQHTISNQTSYPGQFTLTPTPTTLLKAGTVQLMTTVTSMGNTISFWGTIKVLENL